MTFEVRELEGSLFLNDRKVKPRQPDYTGRIRIGDVVYRLVGWKRESKSGTTYLSLRAEQDRSRAEAKPDTQGAQNSGAPLASPVWPT